LRVFKLLPGDGSLGWSRVFRRNITTEEWIDFLLSDPLEVGEAKLMPIQIGKDPSQAHTSNYQGYSYCPRQEYDCKVMESGHLKSGKFD